jgi:hypothetical protein
VKLVALAQFFWRKQLLLLWLVVNPNMHQGGIDKSLAHPIVGRVEVESEDHLCEVGITESEGGLARADAMDRPVDRIEVHRREHRRQLHAVLHVQIDRLVTV